MSQRSVPNSISRFSQGNIMSLPYIQGNECKIDITWDDKQPDEVHVESLPNLLRFWPEIFNVIEENTQELEWNVINYFNDELRILLEIPTHKDVYRASFILLSDKQNSMEKIGFVASAVRPNDRYCYEFNANNYSIAFIAHFDFDKFKKWPQKRNESVEQCVQRMTKKSKFKCGYITHCDRYKILVRKSKHGLHHDFLEARSRYLEFELDNMKKKYEKNGKKIQKIYETVIGDFGFDASRFLDTKYKSINHRPATPFSDALYKILNKKCKEMHLEFDNKGDYYHLDNIPMTKMSRIFDPSHLLVTFNSDPIHELFMGKMCLYYNSVNHRLTFKFKTQKRTEGPNGDWIYN